MNNIKPENYRSLPRVEVSFQDHFCGCEDEITITVKYILDKLVSLNIQPKIGDKILLLEKDEDQNNKCYYIGNVGEIIELDKDAIKNYSSAVISSDSLTKIDDKIIMIKIDKSSYFNIYDLE